MVKWPSWWKPKSKAPDPDDDSPVSGGAKPTGPAEPEVVAGADRKHADRTVIAQISDLHLDVRSNLDRGAWAALRQALREQRDRVDLLVVSGDLVELPRSREEAAYRKARAFLVELAECLEIDAQDRLLVVPGNHDVRSLVGAFDYRQEALEAFRRVFRREMPTCRLFPRLKVVTFLFDSNDRELLGAASGYVEPEDLNHLRRLCQELADKWPDPWQEARRIGILHHHPMPIGPTQKAPDQLKGGEPLMLLKNAGVFMAEVLRSEIELVLHGHRHYPAVSRASFRTGGDLDRSLLIVAAGSVGKDDDTDRSFEILTLEDSGEIRQLRYRRKEASYVPDPEQTLVSYAAARAARIRRSLERSPPDLDVKVYTCRWSIQAGSGDADVRWTLEGTRAFGSEPVAAIPREFRTRSGYVLEPRYSCSRPQQKVRFVPVDSPTKGQVEYLPALAADPITYSGEVRVINAYHFNRQDRLDATGKKSDRETVSAVASQFYGTLALAVTFPPGWFPRTLTAEAVAGGEKGAERNPEAEAESAHIRRYLVISEPSGTASLVVPEPLPGYLYKISWELPETEFMAADFEASISQEATEIRERLLDGGYRSALERALDNLRWEVGGEAAEILDAALFVYRNGKLRPVAAAGSSTFRTGLLGQGVVVGRTHVGQAYRRREAVVGIRTDETTDSKFYFQPGRDPEVLARDRAACVAIPLVHPTTEDPAAGLRLAVLWVGSNSRLSLLNALSDDEGLLLEKLEEGVRKSFKSTFLDALGLELDPETGRLVSSAGGSLFDDR